MTWSLGTLRSARRALFDNTNHNPISSLIVRLSNSGLPVCIKLSVFLFTPNPCFTTISPSGPVAGGKSPHYAMISISFFPWF
jgi:hypothetical protein